MKHLRLYERRTNDRVSQQRSGSLHFRKFRHDRFGYAR